MENACITLAIESAIGSGSLSILHGEMEIGFWVGTKSVSRAEDLLEEISFLLAKNRLEIGDVDLIAVSSQFGSHTGLRIGLSTALGLKRAGGCDIASVSLLSSFKRVENVSGKIIYAVSGNLKNVYAQVFAAGANCEPEELTKPMQLEISQFFDLIESENADSVIANELLSNLLTEKRHWPGQSINAGNNLARLIGLQALQVKLPKNNRTEHGL